MNKTAKAMLIIAAVLAIALAAVAYYAFGPRFAKLDARVRNDIRQEYIVQDAKTRVSTYEWFYDQYGQIEATRLNLEAARGTEEERGIEMVLNSMIAEYNSMARKEHTRAKWMPDDLPYQIEH